MQQCCVLTTTALVSPKGKRPHDRALAMGSDQESRVLEVRPKRRFIAQSPSGSPFRRPGMTKIF